MPNSQAPETEHAASLEHIRRQTWALAIANLTIDQAKGAPFPFPSIAAYTGVQSAAELLAQIAEGSKFELDPIHFYVALPGAGEAPPNEEKLIDDLTVGSRILRHAFEAFRATLPGMQSLWASYAWCPFSTMPNGTRIEVVEIDFALGLAMVKAPNGDIDAGPHANGEMKLCHKPFPMGRSAQDHARQRQLVPPQSLALPAA